jgi:hypothetical protein
VALDLRTRFENKIRDTRAAQEAKRQPERNVHETSASVLPVYGYINRTRDVRAQANYMNENPEEFQAEIQDSQPQVTTEVMVDRARAEEEAARVERENAEIARRIIDPSITYRAGTRDITAEVRQRKIEEYKIAEATKVKQQQELAARQAEKERLAKQGEVQLRNLQTQEIRDLFKAHDCSIEDMMEVCRRVKKDRLEGVVLAYEAYILALKSEQAQNQNQQ